MKSTNDNVIFHTLLVNPNIAAINAIDRDPRPFLIKCERHGLLRFFRQVGGGGGGPRPPLLFLAQLATRSVTVTS